MDSKFHITVLLLTIIIAIAVGEEDITIHNATVLLQKKNCTLPPSLSLMETNTVDKEVNADDFCTNITDSDTNEDEQISFVNLMCKTLFDKYVKHCKTKDLLGYDPFAKEIELDELKHAINDTGLPFCKYVGLIPKELGLSFMEGVSCSRVCETSAENNYRNLCKLLVSVTCQMGKQAQGNCPAPKSATTPDPTVKVETKDETSFMAPKEENSIVTPGSSTNTSSSTTAKLSSKPVKVSGSTNSSIVIKTTGVENQATSKNNTTTTLPKTDMKAMSTNIPKPQSTLPIDANTQKTGTETVKGEQHSGAGAATTITNKTNTNSTPSITRKSDTVSKTDSAIGTSDKYKSNDDVVDDKDLYPSKDDDNDYMPPPTNNEHEKSNSESNDKANNNNNQPVDSNTVTTIGHSDFGVGKEKIPNSGHFFAYFLTAIVICITGYVIFHNKQKILAFVIEGRDATGGRRRTKNGVQYSQLQSNVEEVIPSLDKATSVKNFVY